MRQLKAAVFAAVLGLGLLASMAQVSVVRGWNVVAAPGLTFQTGATITFPFGTVMTDTASGKVSITGTTPMFQLGGTSSSFAAFKGNGTAIDTRLSDDSGYADIRARSAVAVSALRIGTDVLLASATAPTISSGFGTSPSIVNNNGTAAFTVNVGTGGVATSGVIGLPAATTGWSCFANDRNTNIVTRQTATTTTTATFTAASAWTASDILNISCFAY